MDYICKLNTVTEFQAVLARDMHNLNSSMYLSASWRDLPKLSMVHTSGQRQGYALVASSPVHSFINSTAIHEALGLIDSKNSIFKHNNKYTSTT